MFRSRIYNGGLYLGDIDACCGWSKRTIILIDRICQNPEQYPKLLGVCPGCGSRFKPTDYVNNGYLPPRLCSYCAGRLSQSARLIFGKRVGGPGLPPWETNSYYARCGCGHWKGRSRRGIGYVSFGRTSHDVLFDFHDPPALGDLAHYPLNAAGRHVFSLCVLAALARFVEAQATTIAKEYPSKHGGRS